MNIKIKGAEKQLKEVFTEMKAILSKPEEDIVFPNCTQTVDSAHDAARSGEFVSFLFNCFKEATDNTMVRSSAVSRDIFKQFLLMFIKTMKDDKMNDIFMNCLGKLRGIL